MSKISSGAADGIISDIRAGISRDGILRKYRLTSSELDEFLAEQLAAQKVSQAQINTLNRARQTSHGTGSTSAAAEGPKAQSSNKPRNPAAEGPHGPAAPRAKVPSFTRDPARESAGDMSGGPSSQTGAPPLLPKRNGLPRRYALYGVTAAILILAISVVGLLPKRGSGKEEGGSEQRPQSIVEVLDKKGDQGVIPIKKGVVQPIHVNLKWDFVGTGADLDVRCLFRLKDGRKAVIGALEKSLGKKDEAPFITLDKDDRLGTSEEGENLYIYRPDLIDLAVVCAHPYGKRIPFSRVAARLSVKDHTGKEFRIVLDNPEDQPMCAVASIRCSGDHVTVTKDELYFADIRQVDGHYGFDLSWTRGQKDP